MKKLVVLVLLVPMLALTMISCDADMRSNLAGFMGGFGGNVYESAGFIEENAAKAAAVEAAVTTITAIGTSPVVVADGPTSTMGLAVTVDSGTKLLAPQENKDDQNTFKNGIETALETDKSGFLAKLKDPATDDQKEAAKGTIDVFNNTLDALKTELGENDELNEILENLKLTAIGAEDTLTQGDMLALQLMTDLIFNTVDTLTTIGGGDLGDVTGENLEDNTAELLNILDDLYFLDSITDKISGSTSINFSGKFDFTSLLEGYTSKGISPHDIPLYEIGGVLHLANGLRNTHNYDLSDLYSDLG